MLRQALEPMMSGKEPEARDLLDSLLHMIFVQSRNQGGRPIGT